MNGSPLKTTNMAPTGGLFGSQQCTEDNVEASENNTGNTPSNDAQFGQPRNQFHPQPVYSYLPSQAPFPGAPQFNNHAPFNITPSSQPSFAAISGYPSYGPSWQGYNFPRGSFSGRQMFPRQRFPGQGPSSPGAVRVPPALPGNIPVSRPISSTSTPYGQLPGPHWRHLNSPPTKRFQLAAKLRMTHVAGIVDSPPLPEVSYDKFNADYESYDSSDLVGAEGKAPFSLKQTEFSLKQFTKSMRQPNFTTFNKWKKR